MSKEQKRIAETLALVNPAKWLLDVLCRAVSNKGMRPEQLFEIVRSHAQLKAGTRLTLGEFGALHRIAIHELQDEFLALPCSGDVQLGTFKLMCQSMLSADTIGSAMQRGIAFHGILRGSNIGPVLRTCGGTVGIGFDKLDVHEGISEGTICSPQEAIFGLLIWHGFLSWLSGYKFRLKRVDLASPKQELPAGLSDLFAAPINFDAAHSQLVIDQPCLDFPVLQSETSLSHLLRNYPESLLSPRAAETKLTQRILALLESRTSELMPGVEEIAFAMNVSVSSLHRPLRLEQTSVQELKDQYRRSLVTRLLADRSLSLTEVALTTGFAEPSTFFRSFRRWTGMTPNEFRNQIS